MNAPANLPKGSARITYRGRDQFVARLPRHRSAIWAPPHRHVLTRRQAALTILATPLVAALLVAALVLIP